jgi:hypothetical protein
MFSREKNMAFKLGRGLPTLSVLAATFTLALASHTAYAATVVPSNATFWTLDSTSFAFDAGISLNYTASNGDLINRLQRTQTKPSVKSDRPPLIVRDLDEEAGHPIEACIQ